MITTSTLYRILKRLLHTEEEDNITMRIRERINLIRRVDKQMRIRKESTIKKQQNDKN
jgi:hypothetical protein